MIGEDETKKYLQKFQLLSVVEYTLGNGEKELFIETSFQNGQRFPLTIAEAEIMRESLNDALYYAKNGKLPGKQDLWLNGIY